MELSRAAVEEFPRNPVGRRHSVRTIREYTAKKTPSKSGENLHSFCGQFPKRTTCHLPIFHCTCPPQVISSNSHAYPRRRHKIRAEVADQSARFHRRGGLVTHPRHWSEHHHLYARQGRLP